MARWRRFLAFFILAVTLTMSLLLSSCGENYKSVGTCAGFDVYEDEYRFVTMQYKYMMQSEYGSDIWSDPQKAEQYRDELTQYVLKNLTVNYAVLSLAEEAGFSLKDSDVSKLVESRLKNYKQEIEQAGYDYKSFLAENYMTEHYYKFVLGCDVLETQLIYTYADDLGIIKYSSVSEESLSEFYDFVMDGGFILTYHIYVKNDPGEDIEANRNRAEEARDLLVSGQKTVSEMVGGTYNEDVYETKPYCFTRGEMDAKYENAAFALAVGEVSPVIETGDGFYVIIRQPMTSEYASTNIKSLLAQYQYQAMQEILDAVKADLSVELNEYGKSIDLVALK
ncbi:MAG: peptidylprolyl isomerase [Clostridia bacterium]|nr:peptidylprolyl isomerase [Clostridia bacterium]